jgi:hypothetical protein
MGGENILGKRIGAALVDVVVILVLLFLIATLFGNDAYWRRPTGSLKTTRRRCASTGLAALRVRARPTRARTGEPRLPANSHKVWSPGLA